MRAVTAAHEPLPKGLELESLSIETGRVSIRAASESRRCICPPCGHGSSRIHNRYTRTVSDLPWHRDSVRLEVRARRLFCDEAAHFRAEALRFAPTPGACLVNPLSRCSPPTEDPKRGGMGVVKRGELTDEAWERIEPLLPENGRRGKQWRDHREVVNGILWKLRTGSPWRDLPSRYGPWQTCHPRFSRCRGDGTWDHLLAHT